MEVQGKEMEIVEQKLSKWNYFCISVTFNALMNSYLPASPNFCVGKFD